MPARYAFSLNGENYNEIFSSREEALAAAISAGRDSLLQPQTVYVGRRVEADPHAAGHAKTLLREMAWQAHDEVASGASNFLNQLSDETIHELDHEIEKVVIGWMKRHELMPTHFKIEGISEHSIPSPSIQQSQSSNDDEVHQMGMSQDTQRL